MDLTMYDVVIAIIIVVNSGVSLWFLNDQEIRLKKAEERIDQLRAGRNIE